MRSEQKDAQLEQKDAQLEQKDAQLEQKNLSLRKSIQMLQRANLSVEAIADSLELSVEEVMDLLA